MNCSTFKNKLNDYVENNLYYDMMDAMRKHMEQCDDCRKLYEKEKALDNMFRNALKVENVEFDSLRLNIISGIDKTKYENNKKLSIIMNLRKNKNRYLSTAAIFIILIYSLPYMSHHLSTSKSSKMDMQSNRSTSSLGKDTMKQAAAPNVSMDMNSLSGKHKEVTATPEFSKALLSDTNSISDFGASIKYSQDDKIVAYTADDKASQSIIVKNDSKKDTFKIQLINDNNNIISYWDIYDDNNLIVALSNKNTKEIYDNKIYLLNTESLSVKIIYQTVNEMQDIASIQKEGNTLKLMIRNYTSVDKKDYSTVKQLINIAK